MQGRGINSFMNHADIHTEASLFAILDLLRPTLGQTREQFVGEIGENVSVRTSDPISATYFDDQGQQQFHATSIIAWIDGHYQFRPFAAYLQIERDPNSFNDIMVVRWMVREPEVARAWADGVVKSGRMDGLRRLRGDVPAIPPDSIRHCWPWRLAMGLLWIGGPASTGTSREFAGWVSDRLPADVLRLLGGQHEYQDGEVVVFFMLTNTSTFSDLLEGPAGEPRMSPTLLLTDAVTVVVVNWLATIALRLQGVAIHSHADDECVGHVPLTPELVEGLEAAQKALWAWLSDTHGDRLPILLDRLTWNADLRFSRECRGSGDDRGPVDLLPGQPSLGAFL